MMESNSKKNRSNTLYWAAGIGSLGLAWYLYKNVRTPATAGPTTMSSSTPRGSYTGAEQKESLYLHAEQPPARDTSIERLRKDPIDHTTTKPVLSDTADRVRTDVRDLSAPLRDRSAFGVETAKRAASDIGDELHAGKEKTKEKASDMMEKAKEKGSELKEKTKEKASDMMEKTKEKASELADRTKQKVSDKVEDAKQTANRSALQAQKAGEKLSQAGDKMTQKTVKTPTPMSEETSMDPQKSGMAMDSLKPVEQARLDAEADKIRMRDRSAPLGERVIAGGQYIADKAKEIYEDPKGTIRPKSSSSAQ